MACRICSAEAYSVLNLGNTPAENYLLKEKDAEEQYFPLNLEYFPSCSNVQLKVCLPRDYFYSKYF